MERVKSPALVRARARLRSGSSFVVLTLPQQPVRCSYGPTCDTCGLMKPPASLFAIRVRSEDSEAGAANEASLLCAPGCPAWHGNW